MKRIALSLLSALICLCILLVACGENSDSNAYSQDNASESSDQNGVSYDASNEFSDESFAQSSSAPDSSIDASSAIPPSTEDEASADNSILPSPSGEINLNCVEKSAIGYRIAYTKVNETMATDCVTNPIAAVTAIFDGAVTRFFDALTGEYYHTLYGKYLTPTEKGFSGASGAIAFNRQASPLSWEDDNNPKTIPSLTAHYNGAAYYGDFALSQGSCAAAVDANGVYGAVWNQKIVLPFSFSMAETLQGSSDNGQTKGSVGVFRVVDNGITYYYSSNGINLTPDGFTCGSAPYGNRAWVFNNGQGYILEFN